jgi:hypothetical protein
MTVRAIVTDSLMQFSWWTVKVMEELQNVLLQRANIDPVRQYSVGIRATPNCPSTASITINEFHMFDELVDGSQLGLTRRLQFHQ